MSTHCIKRIVSDTVEIPTLPPVVRDALELIDRPTSTVSELEDVLSKDQVISARMLRIANSAFIGMERKVERIFHAVSMLGFSMVKALLVGAALKDMHRQLGPTEKVMWEHSIGVSFAAALIARATGAVLPETALVCGLLHDIGRTAINNSMPKLYAEVIKKESEGLGETVSLERESLGFSHCEVGESIAAAWKFPKSIAAAIRWHHQDNGVRQSAETGNGYGRLCNVISLADEMCLCLGIGFARAERVTEELLTRVGITGTKFAELSTEFRDTFSEQKGYLLG